MDQQEQSSGRKRAQAILHYFGALDMFRVVQDQENCLTSASTAGSVVSMVTSFFIVVLMIQETYLFFRGEVRSSMFVPSIRVKSEPMEPVHLSVSFPDMRCDIVGIAIVDEHGNMLPDLMRPSSAKKVRLSHADYTKSLGAYKEGMSLGNEEGCKVDATIMIDKVPGHFLVGALGHFGSSRGSSQHIIHGMWIGNVQLDQRHDNVAENVVNPLKNMNNLGEPRDTMYKFYTQVVPTYFRNDNGGKVKKLGYQHTVSTTKIRAPHMPAGLYFSHKHSTLAVEYRYHYETWSHFIVNLCAIVGGVFTVMSFISSAVEAVGDTPTAAKLANFVANYFAGRRRAAAEGGAPAKTATPHQAQHVMNSSNPSAAPFMPMMASQGSLHQTAAGSHSSPASSMGQYTPMYGSTSAAAPPPHPQQQQGMNGSAGPSYPAQHQHQHSYSSSSSHMMMGSSTSYASQPQNGSGMSSATSGFMNSSGAQFGSVSSQPPQMFVPPAQKTRTD